MEPRVLGGFKGNPKERKPTVFGWAELQKWQTHKVFGLVWPMLSGRERSDRFSGSAAEIGFASSMPPSTALPGPEVGQWQGT